MTAAKGSRWRMLLLIVHITASVSLIGTALVLVVLGVSGLRGADPRTVYPAAHLMEVWVAAPLAVIALATGIAQARLTGWGLFRHWWVTVKLTGTAGFTVVIFAVIIPRLAVVAADATAGATFTTAQRLPLAIVPAVATALLVLNATLGVLRPGRPIRPTRRTRRGQGERRTPSPV